jgi:acylphosphatase
LDRLVAALRRGPRAGLVTEVETTWEASTGEFSGFHVRRTV